MPMSDPVYTVSGRFGEVTVTVRADDGDALRDRLVRYLDEASVDVFLDELFTEAFLGGSEAARATRNVNRSVPVRAVSHNGPAVPQQGVPVPGPQGQSQAVSTPPPTVTYPGDCQHGQRVYIDSVVRGSQWRRWECAIQPWTRQNANSRCRAVNA